MVIPESRHHLLIVEDDSKLGPYMVTFLEEHGFWVDWVTDGFRAMASIRDETPDLVILDLGLPGMDGLSLCREVRSSFSGLILMFTARDGLLNEVLGLELGADDYLVKPLEPRRLLARIRALLRRLPSGGKQAVSKPRGMSFGSLEIQTASQTARLGERAIPLTTGEFELLEFLAAHAGEILSRDDILRATRGIEYDGLDRSVDVKIAQLRRKLGDDGHEPHRIKTVRGRGYLFVASAW